jgi:hypothetical protein
VHATAGVFHRCQPTAQYSWYDLIFQRCCRNPGISNIPNPGDIGITLTTQIPPFVDDANPNSSPIFNTYPPEAICTNFDFFLDQGATDSDGDSLSYAFCTPLNGGSTDNPSPAPLPAATFNEIPWGVGFGAFDPIPSAPPFEIDAETGAITGSPTTPGAYVIGICVSEYRDGELLSTVMRDFQFNVVMCDPTIISAAQPQSTDQYALVRPLSFLKIRLELKNSYGILVWMALIQTSALKSPQRTLTPTPAHTRSCSLPIPHGHAQTLPARCFTSMNP